MGIDFGTSGARAIAINALGQVCAQVSQRYAGNPTAADWRSRLWQLLADLPPECRMATRAIALNGTSSTVLLCDGAGEPLTEPLMYNDARAASALEPLRQVLSEPQWLNAPGREIVLTATSSLVKLLWWRSQPACAPAQFFLHQADWLSWLLHGQLGISDYHNSLKLGYDVRALRYPDWMAVLPVHPLLPRVVPPGTPIAPLLPAIAARFGFPADCHIYAGTTDSIAAFLASGATTPGTAVTSLGSTLVLKLLSTTPVECGNSGIYSHRLGDRWLVGGASNTGGAVLQDFFTPTELADLSRQIPDRPSPLDYYPLRQPGERFPINDPHLPPRLEPRPADPVAFLHGLLDSMARIEAVGYRQLAAWGATPLVQVLTAGGGAQNAAWTALRSRRLGVPVLPARHPEAAYGTALLAQQGRALGGKAPSEDDCRDG